MPAALPDHSVLMARQGLHRAALTQLVRGQYVVMGAVRVVEQSQVVELRDALAAGARAAITAP